MPRPRAWESQRWQDTGSFKTCVLTLRNGDWLDVGDGTAYRPPRSGWATYRLMWFTADDLRDVELLVSSTDLRR